MKILGIESSCDETAAAVVENGRKILSSIVFSQDEIHAPYGGVVPELASRKHMESICLVVEKALARAEISPNELEGVAATQGPGLIGSLLTGFSFAKAYAFGLDLPFICVNHLLGHIHALFLTDSAPEFPFIALLVSGGHSSIYYMKNHTDMELMGQTRDDAAGEAFDKVAKTMGLAYPGGRIIDGLAAEGNPEAIPFPRAWLKKDSLDFSFSGLKTAVIRHIEANPGCLEGSAAGIAASFQQAVIDVLVQKTFKAAKIKNCNRIAVAGGVAANKGLGNTFKELGKKENITIFIPPPALCTDNAAMIASAGFFEIKAGNRDNFDADVFSRIMKKKGRWVQ